jgi:hypothetical protein
MVFATFIGIDMNLIESMDITSSNNLLIIANIVLIICAIFLLVKVRKSIVKHEEEFEPGAYLKKEKETDLTGIADIKPEEFNPERFDLKKDFFTPATPPKTIPVEMGSTAMKAPATLSLDAVVNDAGILETDELEFEDELPEEFALFQVDSPEIPQPVKQEEKAEEEFVVPPELKLFSLEDKKKPEENTAPPTPEVKTMPPVKEEVKPIVKLAAPPALKLFTLAEKPATLTESMSDETSIQEQKVKKVSKRKSLF